MTRCEHCQAQLLEHLYGLLDSDESLAMIEHASQCDDCRAALLKADLQKKLLSAASKAEFAGLRFEEPAPQVAEAIPMALPLRAPARNIRWRRWAVAAAVFVALTAIGLPAGRHVASLIGAQHELATANANLDQLSQDEVALMRKQDDDIAKASKSFTTIKEQLAAIEGKQEKELREAADDVQKRNMRMVVKGPGTIRSGEPTTYTIDTHNLKGQPAPVRLDAVVRNTTTNQIVFEQKGIQSTGSYQLALNADVGLKGGNSVALELVATSADGIRGEFTERLTLAQAAYVTHLITDKPLYKPGETVFWRSLTLDRFTLKPSTDDLRIQYRLINPQKQEVFPPEVRSLRLLTAEGKEVLGPDKKPIRGIGSGQWIIPDGTPGGEYILEISELNNRFPAEKRKFVVNEYQKARLNKEIKFTKESYGLGSEVVANVHVEKAEGGPHLALLPVNAVVRIDGKAYKIDGQPAASDDDARMRTRTDAEGKASFTFKLPREILKGDASLSVEFTDGANNEAMTRPFNVVVDRMQLEFFPEGGDLVAGVANRVYFQARTMLDKPATVKAVVVDEAGKTVVSTIQTLNDPDPARAGVNQGMGRFSFTPQAGKKYEFKVVDPPGITSTFPLPTAVADGVVLNVLTGVTNDQQPIDVVVQSVSKDRDLLVGVYCRGRLLNFQEMTAKNGQATRLSLKPAKDVGGVYRVTVFEKQAADDNRQQLRPIAERLVYRMATERLNLAVQPDKRTYAPGEMVKLQLTAHRETGHTAPSVLLVGVVDKTVIKMADERTARMMPTHFMLTSEVRRAEDLEYTDVLLGEHPRSLEALDLLLGTQGWRRFLESDPKRLQEQKLKKAETPEEMRCRDDVDRLIVAMGKTAAADQQKLFDTYELRQKQVIEKYAPQFEDVQAQLVQATETWTTMAEGREFEASKGKLQASANTIRKEYGAALLKLRDLETVNAEIRRRVLLAFGLVLLIAGAGSLVIAVTRNLPRAVPFFGTAVAAVAVCGLILLGTFLFDSQMPDANSVALNGRAVNPELDDRVAPRENDEVRVWQDAPDQAGAVQGGRGDLEYRRNANADRVRGGPKAATAGDGKGGGQGGKADKQREPQLGMPFPGDAKFKIEMERKEERPRPDGVPAPRPAPPGVEAKKPDAGRDVRAMPVLAPMAPPGKHAGEGKKNQGPGLPQARNGAQPAQEGLQRQAAKGEAAGFAGLANKPMEQAKAKDADLNQARRTADLQDRALEKVQDKLLKEAQGEARDKAAAAAAQPLNRLRQLKADEYNQAAVPCIFREYPHQRLTLADPDIRADFTETVFWSPVVVLPDGKGEVTFQLCDSVTTFQVVAFGHTTDGRLGACTAEIKSETPFNLNAVVPLEITASDVIDMPVVVANASEESRRIMVSLECNGLTLVGGTEGSKDRTLELKGGDRGRVRFQLKPSIKEGTVTIKLKGRSEPFGSDCVFYTVRVVPEGFPVTGQASDVLERTASHELVLPAEKDLIKKTLKAQLQVFPNTLVDLQKGLEGLLREPHGCFEQTSTTNYPNVLILNYLKESGQLGDNPALEEKTRGLLSRGYGKLVSFECQKQGAQTREGYEWFGGTAPGHEALTAYGLLQFRDMQRVGYPVDEQMIERTQKWLLSRRDGKGGFLRNARALDTFGRAPDHITNAYIVWAITESEGKDGRPADLDKEMDALIKQGRESKDPYFLALVANGLLNRGRTEPALELVSTLTKLQKPEGHLSGTQMSITGSGGRTLEIETTALTVLAWTKANRPQELHKNLNAAIKWISQQRGGQGAFGSTQSTILALKALLALAKSKAPMEPGELKLTINGKPVAKQPFGADLNDTLTLEVPDAETFLKAGKNEVEIEMTSKNILPYTLSWSYQALKPESAEQTPIRLGAKMDRDNAQDGETVNLKVTVQNTAKKGQGMVVAIVGIPAGLNLPPNFEQLKDYAKLQNNGTEPGRISYFEVSGRELILYWRQMAPEQKIELNIELICRVPGDYRGPASRAYLYYNNDHKHWVEPAHMAVMSKP